MLHAPGRRPKSGDSLLKQLLEIPRTLVTDAARKARLATIAKLPTEFITVPVGDGVTLDGYLIKPPDFNPARKYPVWPWFLMLAQQAYIVASVDQRGTPALEGRDWRKSVCGQIGALSVREQSEAAKTIGRYAYVDSTRMGVWGWSGGGSSTLLLMFRATDVYRMGMTVAPVADVHNYNTICQERYVGLPATDSLAYQGASAVNFVNGLKGDLLVVHGTGDDNVHYQGTEQLINALVAANKPFQMMAYPNRTHGIYEGPGTTRHLLSCSRATCRSMCRRFRKRAARACYWSARCRHRR